MTRCYPRPLGVQAINLSMAAHITAAAPGGPRYDASLTPSQRRSPENGIHMCPTHGTLVDRDDAVFPVELVRAWKAGAEAAQTIRMLSPIPKPGPATQQQQFTGTLVAVDGAEIHLAWEGPLGGLRTDRTRTVSARELDAIQDALCKHDRGQAVQPWWHGETGREVWEVDPDYHVWKRLLRSPAPKIATQVLMLTPRRDASCLSYCPECGATPPAALPTARAVRVGSAAGTFCSSPSRRARGRPGRLAGVTLPAVAEEEHGAGFRLGARSQRGPAPPSLSGRACTRHTRQRLMPLNPG